MLGNTAGYVSYMREGVLYILRSVIELVVVFVKTRKKKKDVDLAYSMWILTTVFTQCLLLKPPLLFIRPPTPFTLS